MPKAASLLLASGLALFTTHAFAADAGAPIDTHTIFLNNCQPSGCPVSVGSPDARIDRSDLPSSGGKTLSAFGGDATAWSGVVSCIETAYAPFDIDVVTTRPASGDYFQIMIGGQDSDLGIANGTGAIGDTSCSGLGTCSRDVPHELAFAFAADFSNDPARVCAAALDAIGLSWALDHVVDATDSMSYNFVSGQPSFHDGEACGGDCDGSNVSPFGLACTGSGATATHACISNNSPTQDETQMLLALFGPAPVSPDAGVSSDAGIGSDAGPTGDGGGATTTRSDGGTGDDAAGSGDDSGCGCATVRSSNDPLAFGVVAGVALVAIGRRRRRARRTR